MANIYIALLLRGCRFFRCPLSICTPSRIQSHKKPPQARPCRANRPGAGSRGAYRNRISFNIYYTRFICNIHSQSLTKHCKKCYRSREEAGCPSTRDRTRAEERKSREPDTEKSGEQTEPIRTNVKTNESITCIQVWQIYICKPLLNITSI